MANNQAFIDAQNLYLGTTQAPVPWTLDLARFRVYLTQKYRVNQAYYFMGAYDSNQNNLYDFIDALDSTDKRAILEYKKREKNTDSPKV